MADQPGSFGAGHATPRSFVEGGASSANGSVNVGFISLGHDCPDIPRIRVTTLKGSARLGIHPFTSDEHLVVAHFPGHWCLDHLHMHLLLDGDLRFIYSHA